MGCPGELVMDHGNAWSRTHVHRVVWSFPRFLPRMVVASALCIGTMNPPTSYSASTIYFTHLLNPPTRRTCIRSYISFVSTPSSAVLSIMRRSAYYPLVAPTLMLDRINIPSTRPRHEVLHHCRSTAPSLSRSLPGVG